MGFIEKLLCKIFPHRDILSPDGSKLYMRRWFLSGPEKMWSRSKIPLLCLHKICISDGDRDPHTHPSWFCTLVVWGNYLNEAWGIEKSVTHRSVRRIGPFYQNMHLGKFALRTTNHIHRVILKDNKPVWTVVLLGRSYGSWGFIKEDGRLVPWKTYLKREQE